MEPDITVKDRASTNEQLTVDTAKVVPFYVDDIDKIQNKWDAVDNFAADGMRELNNILDQAVLAEYTNATSDVYNDDVGGSGATTAIPLTTSNIQQLFTASGRKLNSLNMPVAGRFAVIGARTLELIQLYVGGKDTNMADVVGNNGRVMERFGFELFFSNNVPYTATWTPANNPTEADTVTIAGVTFTFNATPSGAGSVDIGGTTAVSIDNLVACINDSGTAGTTYIQLTDADRYRLTTNGIVATDGTTNMTIAGFGDIVVAASEAADPWSAQQEHTLMGVKGATDLVVQQSPNVEFRMAEKRLGRFVYPWMLYGKKTFTDMKDALVAAHIDASDWT